MQKIILLAIAMYTSGFIMASAPKDELPKKIGCVFLRHSPKLNTSVSYSVTLFSNATEKSEYALRHIITFGQSKRTYFTNFRKVSEKEIPAIVRTRLLRILERACKQALNANCLHNQLTAWAITPGDTLVFHRVLFKGLCKFVNKPKNKAVSLPSQIH